MSEGAVLVDPEDLYRTLVSGNSATVRGQADTVGDAIKKVEESAIRVDEAADRPKWTSAAAAGYRVRTAGVSQGIQVNRFALGRLRTALTTGAHAYDAMASNADTVIGHWRNRPAGLNPVVKDLLALLVHLHLVEVSANYNERLAVIAAFASGERIDRSQLDADTLKWLAQGMEKTAEWLEAHPGSSYGPLIPNLGLTGDTRGLIPQGLGIDPNTGFIIQTSYSKDGAQNSVLSMIDPATGREVVDVELGGWKGEDRPGHEIDIPTPDHAGGVASDGKYTYVTSSGEPSHVFTYRTSDIMSGAKHVKPIGPPTELPDGAGAYGTIKDGNLYVGTHNGDIGGGGNEYDGDNDDGRLYRYTPDGHGGWTQDTSFGGGTGNVQTPPQAQGVVVRDGEYVFSASLGRDKAGRLITQERQDDEAGNGDRGPAYELPYMSEGIIELDGEIIATYESGADEYGPDGDDDEDEWINPYMTKTSLADLGLSEDIDVSPESLRGAAADLDTAARPLTGAANLVGGITVTAGNFGRVPAATTLTTALNTELGNSERSLDVGARAVHRTSQGLSSNARMYTGTDDLAAETILRRGPKYS